MDTFTKNKAGHTFDMEKPQKTEPKENGMFKSWQTYCRMKYTLFKIQRLNVGLTPVTDSYC